MSPPARNTATHPTAHSSSALPPAASPPQCHLLGDTSPSLTAPVLVTGGTGFLGRRLVERLLAQGRPVVVLGRTPAPDLERRGVRFVRASLDDAAAVSAACRGIGTVFHVAAKVGVWGRYDDFFRANVLGTRALLAGCREHGVKRFVHTSTPSVVFNGKNLAGADESLPLTTACPSPYPLTKAIAEREVLAAHSPGLSTVALRPHLIWGVGDPHLVPRILARARAGRLRIVGNGQNRMDMVHVENAVDAHLAAESALAAQCHLLGDTRAAAAGGRAYFITNDEPVVLWDWINGLLSALGEPPITRCVSLGAASAVGALCEAAWRVLPLKGEPPMTRFIAAELAKDHWFSIAAARRDLGYVPRISMAAGTAELVAALRAQ
ncbi:MAG: NAD-dependent epimerase/dehydratase family protein [Opitutus sp.]|nr:NAD-dependent epimerase/dehydratase family protein [Opitutus sp.]MCS6247701.1 NAD-dependent epimerase/dehydratase family protein [Opitutus sp.]MCS6274178.1 NAD-dependent epimerase/dehydratase family protein [Opitutus sp.]MCS6277360.1 NAD-dependent epimerase/dehydratase family protein [Opitutus sp.]MCS6300482.1 NAD-dependent epimerase/dehydratase family protein [Opitutus sp.]